MVRVTGDRKYGRRLAKLSSTAKGEVGKAVFVSAGILETDARRSIVAGAIQGAGHIPSAPGDPPNRDTGNLDQNVKANKTGQLTAEVVSEAPYSAALEFGTSKMGERPFMRPAAKRTRPKMQKLVAAAVDKASR